MVNRDPIRIPVVDASADRALEDIRKVFSELRLSLPTLIEDVTLANGTRTVIQHRIGRKYRAVFVSPPKGATATGRIVEEEPIDRTREIWLTATGHGAAVVVDLLVYA